MKTTLGEIKKFKPCLSGWEKLCNGLKTNDLNIEVSILQILEINGVRDAFWALRTQKYRDYCLMLADIAESFLYLYEKKYYDNRPRIAIDAIRSFHKGEINNMELADAADAADAAVDDAAAADAYNHVSAYAADVAAYAAAASVYAAYATATTAVDAACYVTTDKKQWTKNEDILRKHLAR